MLVALLASLLSFSPAPLLPSAGAIAQGAADLELHLEDARTGQPVSGAIVRLREQDRSAISDEAGRVRMTDLETGTLRVTVEAAGYTTLETSLGLGAEGLRQTLRLEPRPVELEAVRATGTPLRGSRPYQPGQALDREELVRRASTSLGEMLDGEPGVAMRSFGPVTGRPVIRGLDGDRVAVLENGRRMGDMSETAPDHAVTMDPLGTARVEVVRGPASLLYGSSALGGVVNLLLDDLPRSWAQGSRAGVAIQGATANRQEAVSASGIHGDARWALTARGALRTSDDVRTPGTDSGVLEETWNRTRSAGVGGVVRSESLVGGLAVDLDLRSFGIPEELDDPDERVELRTSRQRVTGELDWEPRRAFDVVEFRASAIRFDQQEVEIDGLLGPVQEEEVEHDFHRRTLDMAVTAIHGPLGPISAGALGLSFLGQSLEVSGEDEFHPDGTLDALGLFSFQELPLGDGVSVQFGIRGEVSRTRARPNVFFPDLRDSRTEGTLSASLGARVEVGPRLELGAQLARAHRAPRLEELWSDGPHLGAARYEVGTPGLRNEIGHGADLFALLGGDRLRGELALFANRIDDFVVASPTGETDAESGLPVVVWEATPALLRGGEARLELEPVPGLVLQVTGDMVRGDRRGSEGGPLPYMPPNRLGAALRYDAGSVRVGVRGRLAAPQDRVHREDPTDGYALLDLELGFRPSEGQLLSLRLDNALDRVYRDHLSRVEDRRFPMPGRNLSMIWRWTPGA
ncbi:MAG: TonB-dependent receptor [Gemmatimonadales bacterium]|nr:MAG: TonB-dependent receptor [Gemmatimonadales bacterium]